MDRTPTTARLQAVTRQYAAQPQTAVFIDARIAELIRAAALTLPTPPERL
jgi:FMN phosphatase YigB (HAD superfamily)